MSEVTEPYRTLAIPNPRHRKSMLCALISTLLFFVVFVLWLRSDDSGSTVSDEVEIVCHVGVALHSFNNRLYFSIFEQPGWSLGADPLFRIEEDHGFSAAMFSHIVITEYGRSFRRFGCAFASMNDADPPAMRKNVAVVTFPYWFPIFTFAIYPVYYSIRRFRRGRDSSNSSH